MTHYVPGPTRGMADACSPAVVLCIGIHPVRVSNKICYVLMCFHVFVANMNDLSLMILAKEDPENGALYLGWCTRPKHCIWSIKTAVDNSTYFKVCDTS